MIINVISMKRVHTISLPQKVKGQYWIEEATDRGIEPLLAVEGIDDTWKMRANRSVRILDKSDPDKKRVLRSKVLTDHETQYLIKKNGERIIIYTEPISDDRQVFRKYGIPDGTELTIGRWETNDIRGSKAYG